MAIELNLTLRGEAILAAVEAGVIPAKSEGDEKSWDTEAFQQFWDRVEQEILPKHAADVLRLLDV